MERKSNMKVFINREKLVKIAESRYDEKYCQQSKYSWILPEALSVPKMDKYVRMVFDEIIEYLSDYSEDKNHKVYICGFGIFRVKNRYYHTLKNPKTGEIIKEYVHKRTVRFEPAKKFKDCLN